MKGEAHTVKRLLDDGADVNEKDKFGRTALLKVVDSEENNKVDILKILIANGADINAVDEFGYTALSKAKENGDRKIIKLLNEHQKPESNYSKTLLSDMN